jgi:multidrug efflux pump subunit AcrA (membrane-fusion protein)
MTRAFLAAGSAALFLLLCGCSGTAPTRASAATEPKHSETVTPSARNIRATGTIEAARSFTVQVPRVEGGQTQGGGGGGGNPRLTLVRLVPNGATVKEGDLLAEFDRTAQLDAAREAQAKYDDLSHQVRQKAAENRSEAEKRALEMKEAEATLGKAQIQLRKGPVLSDIDRLKAEENARSAKAQVESLQKSDADNKIAEAAALRVLELQMERQKVALERAQRNAEKLVVKAQIAGMVALENIWRGGSMGAPQEGDQLFPGQGIVKIFDPSAMEVRVFVSEPDRATLKQGTMALVNLDAYPDAAFQATFSSASPVATSAQGSPIKNFTCRFKLAQSDPRLLPDLSAAVIIKAQE